MSDGKRTVAGTTECTKGTEKADGRIETRGKRSKIGGQLSVIRRRETVAGTTEHTEDTEKRTGE
jgi:hypothetical protein